VYYKYIGWTTFYKPTGYVKFQIISKRFKNSTEKDNQKFSVQKSLKKVRNRPVAVQIKVKDL